MEFRVNIEEIHGDELRVERSLSRDWLDDVLGGDEPTGFSAGGEVKVDARLSRLVGSILLRGEVVVPVVSPCKRCLVDVPQSLPVDFMLNLIQAQPAANLHKPARDADPAEEPQGTFEPQMADEEVFHGKSIDLGNIVREQIILALPMDAVCREGCKGLCSTCGQNLNEKECGHDRRVPDPRWAGLKDIKPTRH